MLQVVGQHHVISLAECFSFCIGVASATRRTKIKNVQWDLLDGWNHVAFGPPAVHQPLCLLFPIVLPVDFHSAPKHHSADSVTSSSVRTRICSPPTSISRRFQLAVFSQRTHTYGCTLHFLSVVKRQTPLSLCIFLVFKNVGLFVEMLNF